jgi:hypothetical protein
LTREFGPFFAKNSLGGVASVAAARTAQAMAKAWEGFKGEMVSQDDALAKGGWYA